MTVSLDLINSVFVHMLMGGMHVCVCTCVCVPITVRMIGARCPDLEPPVNGVLKCQAFDTNL